MSQIEVGFGVSNANTVQYSTFNTRMYGAPAIMPCIIGLDKPSFLRRGLTLRLTLSPASPHLVQPFLRRTTRHPLGSSLLHPVFFFLLLDQASFKCGALCTPTGRWS